MKNIFTLLLLAGLLLSCTENSVTGIGDEVTTGSGTIFGTLLADGEPSEAEATVSLYLEKSVDILSKTLDVTSDSLVAAVTTEDAEYSFDSLPAGTYRIEVTSDSIVIGGEEGIELAEDDSRKVDITIVIIINQTFNISTQENVTINNFILENGKVIINDNGYTLVFGETDTFEFAIEIENNDATETIEAVSVQQGNGSFTIGLIDSSDIVTISTTEDTIPTTMSSSPIISAETIAAAGSCPVAFNNSSIRYEINDALTITSDCEVVFGPNITIDVKKPITISNNGTLRIKKGTTLRFASTAYIAVGTSGSGKGTLIATGTESDSVQFVRLSSTGNWGSGGAATYHGGIRFHEEASAACSLTYCTIKSAYVGVRAASSNPTICNTSISGSSKYGINFTDNSGPAGTSAFHHNTISENEEYGIILPAAFVGFIDSSCVIKDNTKAGILIHEGNVEEDVFWSDFEDQYELNGNITVGSENGATLTILPGAVFSINSGSIITIGSDLLKGTLIANGTADDSIVFTSTSSTGYWGMGSNSNSSGAFFFQDGASKACSLTYCIINRGYTGIIVNNSAITVSHCRISNCKWDGIRFNESAHPLDTTAFTDNLITGNRIYGLSIFANHVGLLKGSGAFIDNGNGGIVIKGDDVKTSALWKKHTTPYCVDGNITIASEEGTVLIIEAGTKFKMIGTSTIHIGASVETGTLIANGTADDSITFSGYTADSYWGQGSVPSQGGAIRFNSGATSACSLTYCIINSAYTGVVVSNTTLTISHCRISNNKVYGIRFEDNASPIDSASFINNTITGNGYYAITLYANYLGTLSGTGTIADNSKGGILVYGDVIDQDAVWKKHDAYYVVDGKLAIGSTEGTTVTIRPGATFLMGNAHITVGDNINGTLIANGTETEQITFGALNSGSKWGAGMVASSAGAIILFSGSGENTSFDYCTVDNGNSGFRIINNEPIITNCTISNSKYYGIYLSGSEGSNISGNSFSGNAQADTYTKE